MLFSLLIALVYGHQAIASDSYVTGDCGYRYETNRYEPTISNGTTTKNNEFPWHVALYRVKNDSVEYICGGSIIDPIVIVTGAHCVFNEAENDIDNSDIFVATGKYHSSWDVKDRNEKRYKVIRKKIKKTYIGEKNRYADDIALLALNETIKFNSLIMPICIDWSGRLESSIENQTGLFAGWGYTESEDKPSEKLLKTELHHIDFTECRHNTSQLYSTYVTSDKFCTKGVNQSRVEQGDSGGGLMYTIERTKQYYIYGILSGRDKDIPDLATFTNITVHMAWLNSTMKNIRAEVLASAACGKRFPVSYTNENGKKAVYNDYPWLATIYIERNFTFFGVRCVGSIIHQRAILTSAWCLDDLPDLYQPAKYRVLVGKHELNIDNKEGSERSFKAEKIHKHESYKDSGDRAENDIAIIVVDDDIVFTKEVVPICFDYDRKLKMYEDPNKTGMIASWNLMDCHCQEEATYKYISHQNCSKFLKKEEYQKYITAEKFCGQFVKGAEFLYSSDSGSGLIYSQNSTNGYYIYGVVCKGRPSKGDIATFTRIESSLRWISDTLDTIYNSGDP